jgi:hypothetical protein
MQHRYTRHDFRLVLRDGDDAFLTDLPERIARWSMVVDVDVRFSSTNAVVPETVIRRLVLDIREPSLQAIDYEGMLGSLLRPGDPNGVDEIVRASFVPPRAAATPMTLPLRVLVLDNPASGVPQAIEHAFGQRNAAMRDRAMVADDRFYIDDIADFCSPAGWPVTDVLHFTRIGQMPEEMLLATQSPSELGTLAWITRLADVWRTRLIVLDVADVRTLATARKLAAGIARRGGPGVVLRPPEDPRAFYERIVHDIPLDALRYPWAGNGNYLPAILSIFGGQGREELVRFSTIGERIAKLIAELPPPPQLQPDAEADADATFIDDELFLPAPASKKLHGKRRLEVARDFTAALDAGRTKPAVRDFASAWEAMSFNLHESEGLIPLATELERLRETIGTVAAPEPSKAPRHVNASLWSLAEGEPEKLDSRRARLQIGQPYLFRVQIGEEDRQLVVFRSSALLEEHIKWTPEMTGVWIEIGVTGHGFTIDGEPLQEVWLPRVGPADLVSFPVVPEMETPVLRYTVYCRGSIVQTSRLAAVAADQPDDDVRKAMAEALGIPLGELPVGTIVSRTDYAGASAEEAESLPPRTVAIVANHTHGKRSVSVKGAGFLLGAEPNAVEKKVEKTRDTLYESSANQIPGIDREKWPYGFSRDNVAHNTKRLREVLPKLAAQGWDLYQSIFPDPDVRGRLDSLLANTEQETVSVAHVLLNEVVPWAAIYDRHYDPNVQNPDAYAVCLAALPQDGKLPATECGTLPECVLHAANLKLPVRAKTVACPLRFWGFRHVIEVPPQQVGEQKAREETKSLPRRIEITAGNEISLAAGINTALPLAGAHVTKLAELTRHGARWRHTLNHRDKVIEALEDPDLDVIYFYCHARGGAADPFLELQEDDTKPAGKIAPPDLNFPPKWGHMPLVFLNGCSTAAFSADAVSPFITTCVAGRGASGVIGTEIPVHELLAGDAAFGFLDRFLAGVQAGPALLAVRRELLEKANPLGLAYTLYAHAELALTRKA